MDPRHSAQDVVRCDVCETPVPPLHCDFCQTNLCKACVGEHILDLSRKHQVVSYRDRGTTPNYPNCSEHVKEQCKLYCEQCDISVCVYCIPTQNHQSHKLVDILSITERKTNELQRDLKELEKSLYPKYQEIASNIPIQKTELSKNYQKLTTAIDKHGEDLHKQIDHMIQKLKSDLDVIDSEHLVVLNKQYDKIIRTISEITQSIAEIKKSLDSNDVSLVSSYKSRNAEFRKLPLRLKLPLPNFTPKKVNTEQLYQQFGSLSAFFNSTEEDGYTRETSEAGLSPLKVLLDKPHIISTADTQCTRILSVACHSDEEVWTCRYTDNILRLFNLQGELVRSTQTTPGGRASDIAATESGNLVYIGGMDRTVKILKNTEIQTVITLQEWSPCGVCSTSSGDLLVAMISDDKEAKVVRYAGDTEIQSIQYNAKRRLYSYYGEKYISENRNLDICVSDYGARAVVVVNQAGKLRFTYTGPPSTTWGSFSPYGITTDSQGRILTADFNNHCVHILDQNGQFLRYIDNCHLQKPWGLCVDTRDNLFVSEFHTGKVKKIQYCKEKN
ncbi:uncharacterized protein LOC128182520 [Crassostrea angulata]|uniref:uncharacterized protein LOC128182520 n=1 Tax=Magallana angulata TaxID=2784310 RepID=UPI0022B1476C|nr:uncharacterized protein LOC128182520 [Crassostrea angulata]